MDLRTITRLVYGQTGEADSRRPLVAEVNGERLRVSDVQAGATPSSPITLILRPEAGSVTGKPNAD